ncbi:MAG: ATP-binding cassette domain-containing protein [Proteobacteria bacterium]|nr:ATP-binding cassette domain-containing protein [Pseudomonadota bacterium]
MIEIEALIKRFGPVAAVAGIDLKVAKGEVLGFLGPNGAGKSTTMKMVTGFLAPTSGRVTVCGHDIETDTIAAQRTIGYLPEGAPAYGDMTPRQFLTFIGRVRGYSGPRLNDKLAAAIFNTDLEPVLDQPIDTLSKGFRRRVGLAQALLHDPPVLILDEPTDGLDPNQKHSVRRLIKAMAPEKAIVVSTHLLEEVEAICTRAVIIDRGRVVADGTPAQLLARSRHHNAVTLTLPARDADAIAAKLKALPSVAGVEQNENGDGTVRLTAFPKGGALPVEDVSRLAQTGNLKISELYAERGRLDEVFYAITTHDTARGRETSA